jgi:hypothetical protein
MRELELIEQDVIRYLVAENEEVGETTSRIFDYITALYGELREDTAFFLGKPDMLCVNTARFQEAPALFNARCGEIKQTLYKIARFLIYLTRGGYVRAVEKPANDIAAYPLEFWNNWRRYADFNHDEIAAFKFARSSRFIPRYNLYKYCRDELNDCFNARE